MPSIDSTEVGLMGSFSRLGKKNRERNNKRKNKHRCSRKDHSGRTTRGQTRLRNNERRWKLERFAPSPEISVDLAAVPTHRISEIEDDYNDYDDYSVPETFYEQEAGHTRFFLHNEVYHPINEDGNEEGTFVRTRSINPTYSMDSKSPFSEHEVCDALSRLSKQKILKGQWSGECELRYTLVELSELCALGRACSKDREGLLSALISLPRGVQGHILSMTNSACPVGPFSPGVYICAPFTHLKMILILYPGLQMARMLCYSESLSKKLTKEDLIDLALDPNLATCWEVHCNGQTIYIDTPMGQFSGHLTRNQEETRHTSFAVPRKGAALHYWAIKFVAKENVEDYERFEKNERFWGEEEDSVFELVLPL